MYVPSILIPGDDSGDTDDTTDTPTEKPAEVYI